MDLIGWIIALLFLPLFPFGMVFNMLFQRAGRSWQRIMLLVLWPLPGLWVFTAMSPDVSAAILLWALSSSLLYAFRAVVVNEIRVWSGYIAISSWSLAWLGPGIGLGPEQQVMNVFAFSLPLVLLVCAAAEIEKRYQCAFAGIVSGVAQAQPRLSGVLVVTMLAVIGSPLFPAFIAMLGNVTHTVRVVPAAALGLTVIWLLWSWSGVRLLQEVLVGTPDRSVADLGRSATALYSVSLLILIACGGYLAGEIL